MYQATPQQGWWVLDNLSETLDPLQSRSDLNLILGFNEHQVARLIVGLDEQVLGSANVLLPWAELLARHSLLRGSASLR